MSCRMVHVGYPVSLLIVSTFPGWKVGLCLRLSSSLCAVFYCRIVFRVQTHYKLGLIISDFLRLLSRLTHAPNTWRWGKTNDGKTNRCRLWYRHVRGQLVCLVIFTVETNDVVSQYGWISITIMDRGCVFAEKAICHFLEKKNKLPVKVEPCFPSHYRHQGCWLSWFSSLLCQKLDLIGKWIENSPGDCSFWQFHTSVLWQLWLRWN